MSKKEISQKSFREQVEVIIRRRWFLVIPFAALFMAAVLLSFVLPPVYQATATVQINNRSMLDPIIQGTETSTKDQVDALLKQITSYPKLERLARQLKLVKPNVSANALEACLVRLKKNITVTMRDKDVIDISFDDSRPARAREIANTLAMNFIVDNVTRNKEEARVAIDFLSEQLKVYKQKMSTTDKYVSRRKIDSELELLANRKALLESQMHSLKRSLPSQIRSDDNPVIGRLQARLAEIEMELSRLLMDATDQHPRVIELKNERTRVKNTLDAEIRKESASDTLGSSNPTYLGMQQELKEVEMQMKYLESKKKATAPDEEGEAETAASGADGEDTAVETGQRVDEDIYRMLLKQMESAYVTERLRGSEKGAAVSLLEEARTPAVPIKPEKIKIVFAGLIFGLMAGLGGVFSMEYLDRSFRTADDAKKFLKIPYLGSVSKMLVENSSTVSLKTRMNSSIKKFIQKKKLFSDIRFVSPHIARRIYNSGIAPQIVIHHEPKSPVSEEYRILRTNIEGLGYESVMKTIMVTSAVRGEGKSTTSVNLSVALADNGRRTLLIDADMRKGTSHELLNVPQTPGLSDVLAKGIDGDAALAESKVRNLTVLPCGHRPMNPSELLGTEKMQKLLASFKARYDAVVIDAPPVLNLPDSNILGKFADGVVMVVQAERTQREDVVQAYSMLVQSHSNVVGFVLTNVQYYIPKYVYDYLYGT